jgi:hypothetical protein
MAQSAEPRIQAAETQVSKPQSASIIVGSPCKARKSAKNPTPAQITKWQARARAAEDAARLKRDKRTADEIYGTNGPMTAETHPHTYSVQFRQPNVAMNVDFMGVRSFQNCLERYIACEYPDKQRSSHRSADTLRRILEKNEIPPPHYPREDRQVCASWRWVTSFVITCKNMEFL